MRLVARINAPAGCAGRTSLNQREWDRPVGNRWI